MLLLHRPRSRNAEWHRRIGDWVVVRDGVVVGRQYDYGRTATSAPLRWAEGVVRGPPGVAPHAPLDAGKHSLPKILRRLQVTYDDLPPSLLGARRIPAPLGLLPDDSDDTSLAVPTALPTVPPKRTAKGKWAQCVLSQEEYELYVSTWREWVTAHPRYDRSKWRPLLQIVSREEVLMHRLLLLLKHGHISIEKFDPLYHRAALRQNRARVSLGATRRQRLEESFNGLLTVIAKLD
jgi:hypothetical protein